MCNLFSYSAKHVCCDRAVDGTNCISNENPVFMIYFAWYQKKNGLSDRTIETRNYYLNKLIKLGANLENPESIKTVIATSETSNTFKVEATKTYTAFTKFKGIIWQPPKTTPIRKEPFIPTKEEISQLISGSGRNTGTLLKLLEETGSRSGEALAIKWTDLDFKAKTVKINNPEKGGNARTLKISNQLISMLNLLKKRKDGFIFNPRQETVYLAFFRSRRRLAEKLQNPRLLQIHFHTLRHYRATEEYYQTKCIKHVQHMLGHRSVTSTERYIQYKGFHEDEYTCQVAKNLEQATELIENGFEYVTEMDGQKLFRKRK